MSHPGKSAEPLKHIPNNEGYARDADVRMVSSLILLCTGRSKRSAWLICCYLLVWSVGLDHSILSMASGIPKLEHVKSVYSYYARS